MKTIQELHDVSFEEIESVYKDAITSPPPEAMIENPAKAVDEEYRKILEEPVYQRAIDNNVFCDGGICVQGLGGYSDVSLAALILFSIVFRISEKIEINEREYSVSIFSKSVLTAAIGTDLSAPLNEIAEFRYCYSKFLLKQDGEKLMFIFSDPVDKNKNE